MNTNSRKVNISLGAYGRLPYPVAIEHALLHKPVDKILGELSSEHLQLCPQNTGVLSVEAAQTLRTKYPDIIFRLHANVRLSLQNQLIDLCDAQKEKEFFLEIARISKALNAPMYSAHAGKRENASTSQVIANSKTLTEQFGIPVAIEGHYPTSSNVWLFSSWQEYQQLLESNAFFVIDLSHLNILAVQSKIIEENLLKELLSCERCLEVHVSHNDGSRDQHLPLTDFPWWWPLLSFVNDKATLFYEGRIPNAFVNLRSMP